MCAWVKTLAPDAPCPCRPPPVHGRFPSSAAGACRVCSVPLHCRARAAAMALAQRCPRQSTTRAQARRRATTLAPLSCSPTSRRASPPCSPSSATSSLPSRSPWLAAPSRTSASNSATPRPSTTPSPTEGFLIVRRRACSRPSATPGSPL